LIEALCRGIAIAAATFMWCSFAMRDHFAWVKASQRSSVMGTKKSKKLKKTKT
jgi:hypothetical protein